MGKVIRFADFTWDGVEVREYGQRDGMWQNVTRHPLVGEAEGAPYHVRYFEVEPGGFTVLERHAHEHVVVVFRGRGDVRLGDRSEKIGFGDVVYVGPHETHQFRASAEEPLGFICVVEAERDPPRPA